MIPVAPGVCFCAPKGAARQKGLVSSRRGFAQGVTPNSSQAPRPQAGLEHAVALPQQVHSGTHRPAIVTIAQQICDRMQM